MSKKNPHWGTTVDEFLDAEGLREAAKAEAVTRVVAWQLTQGDGTSGHLQGDPRGKDAHQPRAGGSHSESPVREKYSQNVGIWTGVAPQPNEVVHMWNYADLNTRMAVRARAFQDPDWLDFVAKNGGAIIEMQSTLLIPAPFSLMK
jgi:hypothetical protein